MQTQTKGGHATRKTAYFQGIADTARRELDRIDFKLQQLEPQLIGLDPARGSGLRELIADLRRRRAETRGRMERALFQTTRG